MPDILQLIWESGSNLTLLFLPLGVPDKGRFCSQRRSDQEREILSLSLWGSLHSPPIACRSTCVSKRRWKKPTEDPWDRGMERPRMKSGCFSLQWLSRWKINLWERGIRGITDRRRCWQVTLTGTGWVESVLLWWTLENSYNETFITKWVLNSSGSRQCPTTRGEWGKRRKRLGSWLCKIA